MLENRTGARSRPWWATIAMRVVHGGEVDFDNSDDDEEDEDESGSEEVCVCLRARLVFATAECGSIQSRAWPAVLGLGCMMGATVRVALHRGVTWLR